MKMLKKFLLLLLFANLLPLTLLVNLTKANDEKLSIYLDWFVNPDHAALVIANSRGIFAKHNLQVELIAPSDPSAPPRLIAAKQGDVAISYQPQLHIQANEGLPLIRFGTLVDTPLNSLVVLKNSGINSIADLKGKKIGYSVGGFENAVLGAMLKQADLSIQDVELININFALSSSLITGAVDGVIGAFRNFELNQLAIENSQGLAFYPEENGVPIYDELILITHADKINDEKLKKLLSALEEATLWILNHPDAALQEFLTAHPDLDNELNRRAWYDTLPRLAKRPQAMDKLRYENFAKFMLANKLIEKIPPLDSYATELNK